MTDEIVVLSSLFPKEEIKLKTRNYQKHLPLKTACRQLQGWRLCAPSLPALPSGCREGAVRWAKPWLVIRRCAFSPVCTCVTLRHLVSWAFSFLICKMGGCLPVLPLYDQKLKKNGLLYIASKILEYTLPRDWLESTLKKKALFEKHLFLHILGLLKKRCLEVHYLKHPCFYLPLTSMSKHQVTGNGHFNA